MLNLFILLLERVGLIIIIAYILMNINHFKTMMNQRDKQKFTMAAHHHFRVFLYDFKLHRYTNQWQ